MVVCCLSIKVEDIHLIFFFGLLFLSSAAPVVSSDGSGGVSVIEGGVAMLYCVTDAEPLHSVTWTSPNGSIISFNEK